MFCKILNQGPALSWPTKVEKTALKDKISPNITNILYLYGYYCITLIILRKHWEYPEFERTIMHG